MAIGLTPPLGPAPGPAPPDPQLTKLKGVISFQAMEDVYHDHGGLAHKVRGRGQGRGRG